MIVQATTYLHRLCVEIPTRRTGSAGNRAATDWFAGTISALGWAAECPEFDCLDWEQAGADLAAGGEPFPVRASPFSPGVTARAPLAVASTVEELEAGSFAGCILLLRGEIASGQLMPRNFPFYNPDEHRRIIAALEAAGPVALVAATGRDPAMAGALYPFPLIEDGDFDIPSAYLADVEGERLARHAGQEAILTIRARRRQATGCNVVARRGSGPCRAVLMAHIDAKEGTHGAIDNAGGVATLLLLAEMLTGYDGALGVEIVAINGEDYYAAPGERRWLADNAGRLGEIVLGVNLDGVGHHGGRPAYSFYGCPAALAALVRETLAAHPLLVEGDAWYQGDHSMLLQNGVPALALTSQAFNALWSEVAHTAADTPALVDPAQLVAVAAALRDLVLGLPFEA